MKVIVIGGVAAGMSAAAKLKRNLKNDVDITVYEKGDMVSYGACGIPYYISGTIKEAASLVERTAKQFAESGIDVKLRHEVMSVDTENKTVTVRNLDTGETLAREYDKLIVGSGARVRKIPPLDVERDNLFVVRTVQDGIDIRNALQHDEVKRVVVVGAGFIGLEVAEACRKQGKDVLLVEFAARILTVMDPEITDRIMEELDHNGVAVRTDSRVAELSCDSNHVQSVAVESRGRRDTVQADMVINCAGIVPNAEFIEVEKAVNGAIVVNERMETSAKDVHAAGDCSIMKSHITGEHHYAPLGTNANKQGKIIAEVLAGKKAPAFKLLGSSAVKLFDLDIAKIGLSEMDAQRMNIDYKMNRISANTYASYYAPGKVLIKLIYHAKTRKILGAQTMGHGTVAPRANYFAIAIEAGMTVDEFSYIDLAYAPPFSGVWDASLIAAHTAK